jgi:molybdopterin/thiamine biosynthesis adenylyltransferase
MGFTQFILADGDTVSATNLNRQFYTHDDVGTNKTTALAKRIHEINPDAIVEEVSEYLTPENISGIVSRADFIFDTIDFLDLTAIVELHDQCELQKKPRITALSVGFDGGVLYFPTDSTVTFRKAF